MTDSHLASIAEQQWAVAALRQTKEWFDLLFDNAPVMLHGVDRDIRLVKVNRCWLQTLGYERDEVLGRKSFDFLIEESRVRAVRDIIPLFGAPGPLAASDTSL